MPPIPTPTTRRDEATSRLRVYLAARGDLDAHATPDQVHATAARRIIAAAGTVDAGERPDLARLQAALAVYPDTGWRLEPNDSLPGVVFTGPRSDAPDRHGLGALYPPEAAALACLAVQALPYLLDSQAAFDAVVPHLRATADKYETDARQIMDGDGAYGGRLVDELVAKLREYAATLDALQPLLAIPRPEHALEAAAAVLDPCPPPDIAGGRTDCEHGVWPCRRTEAAWMVRGLDPRDEVRKAAQDAGRHRE